MRPNFLYNLDVHQFKELTIFLLLFGAFLCQTVQLIAALCR